MLVMFILIIVLIITLTRFWSDKRSKNVFLALVFLNWILLIQLIFYRITGQSVGDEAQSRNYGNLWVKNVFFMKKRQGGKTLIPMKYSWLFLLKSSVSTRSKLFLWSWFFRVYQKVTSSLIRKQIKKWSKSENLVPKV